MPTAIEIDGSDFADDALSLDLSTLPRNEDGSLQVKDIIYHGGAAGWDVLKLSGGKFKSTVYTMTGADSGIITMASAGYENDSLTVIFDGLEPITDLDEGDLTVVASNTAARTSRSCGQEAGSLVPINAGRVANGVPAAAYPGGRRRDPDHDRILQGESSPLDTPS